MSVFTRAALAITAGAVALTTSACGFFSPQPAEPVACAVLTDPTVSAAGLGSKADSAVLTFVADRACGTVTFAAVTANAVAEPCVAPAINVADLVSADPGNRDAYRAQVEADVLPLVVTAIEDINTCVRDAGRHRASDVFGAFHRVASHTVGAPEVLVVSDLVDNRTIDILAVPLGTREEREQAATWVRDSGLAPDLAGWTVTLAGAAVDTTFLTPAQSANILAFWQELLADLGADVRLVSV